MANDVVVFADLVAMLAKSTGTSEALCDSFLRELLALGVEKLTGGDDFAIKGLGTFRHVGADVTFEIDKNFADELNSAFDCFEPIELDDEFDEELFDEAQQEPAQPTESVQPTAEEEPEAELPPLPADETETDEPEESETDEPEESETDEPQEPETDEQQVLPPPIPEEDRLLPGEPTIAEPEEPTTDESTTEGVSLADTVVPHDVDEYGYGYDDDKPSMPRWRLFVYGIVCGIAVAAIAFFALSYFGILTTEQEQNVVADMPAATVADDTVVVDTIYPIKPHIVDTVPAEPASDTKVVESEKEPEAKPITCKVKASTTLCDLARQYYGDYHFWIYIYKENREKIKDPNNLQSGIVLVIPPAEKYGIDADNQASVDKAAAAIDAMK
ncbi:MAG: hypothetical protein ACI31D_08870 [Candidatus Limisoma sp.]